MAQHERDPGHPRRSGSHPLGHARSPQREERPSSEVRQPSLALPALLSLARPLEIKGPISVGHIRQ